MTIYEVILRPIITEKGHDKREGENTLCFAQSEVYDSESCREVRASTSPRNSPLAPFIKPIPPAMFR